MPESVVTCLETTGRTPVKIQHPPNRQRFQLILLKPSHYDDDGYVIRWWRAVIPSNSLAALYGAIESEIA
jgi:hypothetical protein